MRWKGVQRGEGLGVEKERDARERRKGRAHQNPELLQQLLTLFVGQLSDLGVESDIWEDVWVLVWVLDGEAEDD